MTQLSRRRDDETGYRQTGGNETWSARILVSVAGGLVDPEPPLAVWANALLPSTGSLVRLRVPVRVDCQYDPDDSGVIVHAPYLRSSGSGDSLSEAYADLSESVLQLRAELSDEDDENLAPDAKELKRRLAALFHEAD